MPEMSVRQFLRPGAIVALKTRRFISAAVRSPRTAKEFAIRRGAGAAVKVLVHDSDQAFVKERVALTGDRPTAIVFLLSSSSFLLPSVSRKTARFAAGCGIDTYNLLIAAEFADRNIQRHEVEVKTAL